MQPKPAKIVPIFFLSLFSSNHRKALSRSKGSSHSNASWSLLFLVFLLYSSYYDVYCMLFSYNFRILLQTICGVMCPKSWRVILYEARTMSQYLFKTMQWKGSVREADPRHSVYWTWILTLLRGIPNENLFQLLDYYELGNSINSYVVNDVPIWICFENRRQIRYW